MPRKEILEILLDHTTKVKWGDGYRIVVECSVASMRYLLRKKLKCSRHTAMDMIDDIVGRQVRGYMVLKNKGMLYVFLPKLPAIIRRSKSGAKYGNS